MQSMGKRLHYPSVSGSILIILIAHVNLLSPSTVLLLRYSCYGTPATVLLLRYSCYGTPATVLLLQNSRPLPNVPSRVPICLIYSLHDWCLSSQVSTGEVHNAGNLIMDLDIAAGWMDTAGTLSTVKHHLYRDLPGVVEEREALEAALNAAWNNLAFCQRYVAEIPWN
jgi:hypothetical protein